MINTVYWSDVSTMKGDFKSSHIWQFEEILPKFDEQNSEQNSKHKTVSLWRENWPRCVELYAYPGFLEAGAEISKPASIMLMIWTWWAHPLPQPPSQCMNLFKKLLSFKNKWIVHHNVRILILCQHMAPSLGKSVWPFSHWLLLSEEISHDCKETTNWIA